MDRKINFILWLCSVVAKGWDEFSMEDAVESTANGLSCKHKIYVKHTYSCDGILLPLPLHWSIYDIHIESDPLQIRFVSVLCSKSIGRYSPPVLFKSDHLIKYGSKCDSIKNNRN